ncbi:DUF1844 domain-containing protein [Granulicella sp. WH15]|uniref:DUF1844 domain-containing protein n=1 Tax=Granulicella sp. WH15 TaxID=2602070 RepID=UPI001366E1AC|nr:DUF1844 domain-containing protein [Granulicella sp. WH15]QHN02190.1 DUF1844 domain-containing protein [Granulicella sp. WH15]
MSEQNKPFVITDRRRFNAEGESRPDADPSPAREPETPQPTPIAVMPDPKAEEAVSEPLEAADQEDSALPPPTAEQLAQARAAYHATAERLDIAIRSANPGMDHPPAMTFDQLVQSVYMQSILQLGGGAKEGQQPQVDILGARQSIDMLGVLAEKTAGNLSPEEQRLLDSALFELQIAFLEITQALARSAQARQPGAPGSGPGGPRPTGPSIVR